MTNDCSPLIYILSFISCYSLHWKSAFCSNKANCFFKSASFLKNYCINSLISFSFPSSFDSASLSLLTVSSNALYISLSFDVSRLCNLSITSSLFAILSSHADNYDDKAFLLSSKLLISSPNSFFICFTYYFKF